MKVSQGVLTKDDLLFSKLPVSINEVIARLEKTIAWCKINNNCAGYFAVLYHKVTCKVKDCIADKNFEDGLRMEKLDVIFASRYLDTFYLGLNEKPTTQIMESCF